MKYIMAVGADGELSPVPAKSEAQWTKWMATFAERFTVTAMHDDWVCTIRFTGMAGDLNGDVLKPFAVTLDHRKRGIAIDKQAETLAEAVTIHTRWIYDLTIEQTTMELDVAEDNRGILTGSDDGNGDRERPSS